jgi:1,4-alpha-glucan branching enzyme
LVTLATAGGGYLNFMGNEFGHPEWIDFPRQGNNWSYKHARRQWHLVDDPALTYQFLAEFDRTMIATAKKFKILEEPGPRLLYEHSDNKLLIFERAGLIFAFNFHPDRSYSNYRFEAPPGTYQLIVDSDARPYGGHGRLAADQKHFTFSNVGADPKLHYLSLYLPCRTALILERLD